MNYNDFPILSDEEYFNLNKTYQTKQIPPKREFFMQEIRQQILECLNLCYCLPSNFNITLTNELENSKTKLLTILDNLNLEKSEPTNKFKTFNLFNFLRKTTLIAYTLKNWLQNEEKEYYKNLVLSNLNIVLEILNNMFLKLEKINLKIYKYM